MNIEQSKLSLSSVRHTAFGGCLFLRAILHKKGMVRASLNQHIPLHNLQRWSSHALPADGTSSWLSSNHPALTRNPSYLLLTSRKIGPMWAHKSRRNICTWHIAKLTNEKERTASISTAPQRDGREEYYRLRNGPHRARSWERRICSIKPCWLSEWPLQNNIPEWCCSRVIRPGTMTNRKHSLSKVYIHPLRNCVPWIDPS